MGLWQACPETDCPRVLLSQILFLIHLHFNPQSPAGYSEETEPKNKESWARRLCVFVSHVANSKCVSCVSAENNSHLQPSTSPSSSKHSQKPVSFFSCLFGCVWVTNAAPHKLFPSCWVVATGFGDFIPFFFYSSQPFSLISSFCLPSLNRRRALICIFMGRCTVWAKTTGEFLYPADFSDINTIPVGPPKTGLIMQHSDCRFVFLFVIGMGDDSGRCKWDAQQGGADTLIYIHKACDICKREKRNPLLISLQDGFPFSLMIM